MQWKFQGGERQKGDVWVKEMHHYYLTFIDIKALQTV